MSRAWYIQGECMVSVKGSSSNVLLASLQQLGLAEGPIQVSPEFRHNELSPDAWGGGEIPADIQAKLAAVTISMRLIHYDAAVLDQCLVEALGGNGGGTLNPGQMPHTGQVLGNGNAMFSAGCHFISLNLSGPISGKPYRFRSTYMTGQPLILPLGTEKSIAQVTFRAIPYATDPWGAGVGSFGATLWDNTADS